ncbi:MAG: hypothetical protein ACLFP4_09575 [Spirochaetales bacterium]
MQTLEEFYEFTQRLHTTRQAITSAYIARTNDPYDVSVLQNGLHAIDKLPGDKLNKRLIVGDAEATVRLDYERRELERDIFFLEHSAQEFQEKLARENDKFASEVEGTVNFLRNIPIRTFLTDRDGTINNYCGHYRSSHQPIYNAVFLTTYARSCPEQSVILTSAPLEPHGIIDLNAIPERTVSLAGSKGREYLSVHNTRGEMEIPHEQGEKLQQLNARLADLLDEEGCRKFAFIGSGVQYKFGQTTVARQDIHNTISDEASQRFLERVQSLVTNVDPEGTTFQIEDTGKDIEIMLTIEGAREFTKGDGVAFLAKELELPLESGTTLVCGDTASDVPMVEKIAELAGTTNTATIFVTEDRALRDRVRETVKDHWFVSSPDVLVTALYKIGLKVER